MDKVRNPDMLRQELDLSQRQLEMVLAFDHIRDSELEPPAMLKAIVKELANQLHADVCQLCLMDRETGQLELQVANDGCGGIDQLNPSAVRDLTAQVIETGGVVFWQEDESLTIPGLSQPSFTEDPALHENKASALFPLSPLPPSGTTQLVGICVALTDGASPEGTRPLGVLLLARSQAPFDQDDVVLLKTAESQIDSAVAQAYAYYELQQRNLELETIYRVDRIRDQNLPFDEMLTTVLQALCDVIQAGMGFVMLYNRAKHRLELRASTHDDLFQIAPFSDTIDRVANEALRQARLVCHNELGDVLRSVMCIPLIFRDEIIGVLGVVNRRRSSSFDAEDRRLLSAIGSQMDTAIFESLERVRLRQVLGRSVDPRVMQRLLANPDVDFLKGERLKLSVLYADIRGSTSLAERTEPELLVGFINAYLSRMTEVILSHEGTLDKFVGDEVMALFGAPFHQPDHSLRAVRVGLKMQEAHQAVMETWRAQGVDAAPIGIGIASGEMTVGEMGSAQRSDYTVIGRPANLGARICSAAKAGQVLISQATYDMVVGQVVAAPVTGLDLKGIGNNITVYEVVRMSD